MMQITLADETNGRIRTEMRAAINVEMIVELIETRTEGMKRVNAFWK